MSGDNISQYTMESFLITVAPRLTKPAGVFDSTAKDIPSYNTWWSRLGQECMRQKSGLSILSLSYPARACLRVIGSVPFDHNQALSSHELRKSIFKQRYAVAIVTNNGEEKRGHMGKTITGKFGNSGYCANDIYPFSVLVIRRYQANRCDVLFRLAFHNLVCMMALWSVYWYCILCHYAFTG